MTPLWHLLQPQRRTRVVDVGSNPIDGPAPYQPLLAAGECELIGFEPQPEGLAALERSRGAHERYLPDALGDGAPATLRLCQAPGMTSLLEPNPEILRHFHGFAAWGTVLREEQIATRRLDDLPEVADLDYLKIDVQGSELAVFRGGQQKLRAAVAIQLEVSFIPLYRQQPLFGEVDAELRRLGLVFHTFVALNRRALAPMVVNGDPYAGLNQLIEADAVYVADFTKLADRSEEKVRQLALIAHACYRSFDLANLCLLELDRRAGDHRLQTGYAELLAREMAAAKPAGSA